MYQQIGVTSSHSHRIKLVVLFQVTVCNLLLNQIYVILNLHMIRCTFLPITKARLYLTTFLMTDGEKRDSC